MSTLKSIRGLAVAVSLLMVAGCAGDPERVEDDYGNSVRHMTAAQTANPSAPVDNNAIDHGDGTRINAAVEAYRKDVSNPQDVKKDTSFKVDNNKQ